MRKNVFTALGILLLVLSITIIAGCRTAQNPTPNEPGQPARFGGTTRDRMQNQNMPNQQGQIGQMGDTDRQGLMDGQGKMGINNRNNTANNTTGNDNLMGAKTDKRVKQIESQITAMEPIENATVVINGNTALVGISVKGQQSKKTNGQLKSEVEEKVKDMSPEITNVVVAEAPDLHERISNLSRDISSGRAMQGLTNEFRQLVDRLTTTR